MTTSGELKNCKKGHHFDPEKYNECPICKREQEKEKNIDPIVGWLVCAEGANKGKDSPMHMGRNFIGRDRGMDICIGDSTVSRTNHASVSYDDKSNKYYYTPGMSRCIDHINEAPVFATVELKARDCIEVGESKFIFIPLCGSNFKWEEWQEDEEE